MGRRIRVVAASTCLALLAAGCASAGASHDDDPVVGAAVGSTSTTTSTTSTTTTTLPPTTTTTLAPSTTAPAPPPTPPPTHHPVDRLGAAFASVGGVVLVYPSAAVERVGFHESADSGAQDLVAAGDVIEAHDMSTRNRGTPERSAADVVVQPGTTIYASVTGTVVQAGHYQLYCGYDDEAVVVAPDGHPSWHVRMQHLQGVLVAAGQHVTAGVTPIATQAHQLPFKSQVDKYSTVRPAWPHVHHEVDDPAIADQPSKGDSCGIA